MKKLVVGITSPISVVLIKGQLRHFVEKNYQVYLMAPTHVDVSRLCLEEKAIHLPVEFKREISPLSDLFALARVLFYFKKVSPDVVNFGTPKASLLGMVASWLLRIPKRVYTCRGFRFEHEKGMKRKLLVAMEKLTGYLATEVICISPSIEVVATDLGIFAENKCIVIGKGSSNGIDLSDFKKTKMHEEQAKKDRDKLGLKGRFVFGFVGRLIDRKGIVELIFAFNTLREKYPEIVLLLVGRPEMDQLGDSSIIDEIDRNPDIILVGWQQDVPRYLSLMDVFVLPAWWEGFGNVLVQAAAMGIPVISTTATGTRDAVSDGVNGTLVPPKDVLSLARVMETYYRDPSLCKRHGQNGPVWARNFNSVVVWDGIEQVYSDA